jgi:glycine cleavage system H protein
MRILGFDYPDDCWFDLEHDMWCRLLEDGRVQVGVTAFGTHLSDDFYMCRPKPVGTALGQGQTMAVAELSKMVVAIKTPVSGTVDEVNPLLEDTPEVINKDPYGKGWLVCIRPERWESDARMLAHGEALAKQAETRMRLEDMDFPPEQGA